MLPGGKVGSLIRKAIPGFATGGVMTHTGHAIVGEGGPELLQLPGGARITPLPAIASGPVPVLDGVATTANFYLDGRLLMTAVATQTADRKARR